MRLSLLNRIMLMVIGFTCVGTGILQGEPPKKSTRGGDPQAAAESTVGDSRPTTMPRADSLGVVTEAAPRILAAHLPNLLEPEQGLVITDITPNSPAAQGGLQRHDILVSFDDIALETPRQLRELVASSEPGISILLGVIRAGKHEWFTAKLAEGRAPRASAPITESDGDDSGFEDSSTTPTPKQAIARSYSTNRFSATLTSQDGVSFLARIAILDEQGREQRKTLKGTRDQIAAKLVELPAAVRAVVSEWLTPAQSRSGQRRLPSMID